MVRLSRQRGGLAALKLTKLFGIDDFPAAKGSGKVLIIIIYCYLISNYYSQRKFHADVYIIFRSPCLCITEAQQHGCSILDSVNLCKIIRQISEVWENSQT